MKTNKINTQQEIVEAELDVILENIPFGVCLKDVSGNVLKVNNQFVKYYNIKHEDIIGNDGKYVLTQQVYNIFKEEDMEIIHNKCGKIFERNINIHNRETIMEVHKEPVLDNNENVVGIVALIKDVTELKKYQDKIKRFAYTDELTGLYNRRSLYEYINNKNNILKEKTCLTVLLIDLDDFKKINDDLGHWYGDRALSTVAKRIKEVCGDAFVARIGGDEFVVIFEGNLPEEILMKKLDEVLRVTNTEFSYEDKSDCLSASIGVVKTCGKDIEIENILKRAFLALYKSKEQGKNQYTMYTEELEEERKFNIEIEKALRDCVKNNEVRVYFQPQYGKNNATGKAELIGFEALFRWYNKKYKHMSVIEVIKTIEKFKFMHIIEEYIMVESFKFAKEINEGRKEKIVVSINVSALQIMEETFVKKVKQNIELIGVSPDVIGVEITETVLLENLDENLFKINELKDLGVQVYLDDFGTGYSSLSYLVKLPLSHVKIDKSFITNMSSGLEYKKLISLIVEAAHCLGFKVVAEGVEKQEELQVLDKIGIDYIQGYIYSKPLPIEEARMLVFNNKTL